MRFVIHHRAGSGSGSTAFATTTTFAASTAIRSNDLKMTKDLRLGAVRGVGEGACVEGLGQLSTLLSGCGRVRCPSVQERGSSCDSSSLHIANVLSLLMFIDCPSPNVCIRPT